MSVIPAIPLSMRQARALTLGVFDGVHIGHQAVLSRLKLEDPDHSLVLTFSSHPDDVLWGRKIRWICSHDQKISLIKSFGARHVLEIPFTRELAEVSARRLVEDVFLAQLPSAKIVLGHDTRFGCHAEGSHEYHKAHYTGAVQSVCLEPTVFEDRPESTTRIREAVLGGELGRAKGMLGRMFSTQGVVVKGFARGRQLGFPTANIQPRGGLVLPPLGVYAVDVLAGGRTYGAVANLGSRPTFENQSEPLLEVHLFDFNGDLYGTEIEVFWKRFIRPERRFASKEELMAQIQADAQEARHGP
ncbi:MAG: riboflavin biosynthesis protein RibF [Planctomycetota bacterium]